RHVLRGGRRGERRLGAVITRVTALLTCLAMGAPAASGVAAGAKGTPSSRESHAHSMGLHHQGRFGAPPGPSVVRRHANRCHDGIITALDVLSRSHRWGWV